MNTATDHILLFAKYPTPGRVKTRLTPFLTPTEAAQLYLELSQFVWSWLVAARSECPLRLEVWHDAADSAQMEMLLPDADGYFLQVGSGLGERLGAATQSAFARGAKRVIVIGSDCPTIRPTTLQLALDSLRSHDVVLGPATDGGYYLIGHARPLPALYTDIPWSTALVMATTQQRIRDEHCTAAILEAMSDIDRPEDIALWLRQKLIIPLPSASDRGCQNPH